MSWRQSEEEFKYEKKKSLRSYASKLFNEKGEKYAVNLFTDENRSK